MSIVKGSIVRAKSRRQKNRFKVVLECNKKYKYNTDEKRRKVEAPKKKSLIHLSSTNTVVKGSIETNPQIKRVLNDFIKNGG